MAAGDILARLELAKSVGTAVSGRISRTVSRRTKTAPVKEKPKKPPGTFGKCLAKISAFNTRLQQNEYFKFFMYVRQELLVLGSQFLAFAYPAPLFPLTIDYPILMGALIAAQGILNPILYLRGYVEAQALLLAALDIGYLTVAIPGLRAMFFETPLPGK